MPVFYWLDSRIDGLQAELFGDDMPKLVCGLVDHVIDDAFVEFRRSGQLDLAVSSLLACC